MFIAGVTGQAHDVRRLLSRGAGANDVDELGRTPLVLASHEGNIEMVDMLLAAEAMSMLLVMMAAPP
jgi:ankyrin repeat protein